MIWGAVAPEPSRFAKLLQPLAAKGTICEKILFVVGVNHERASRGLHEPFEAKYALTVIRGRSEDRCALLSA